MNEESLKELWEQIKAKSPNFMDFPTFKSKMDTPEKRKNFYDKNYSSLVKKEILADVWTIEDFEKEFGPQKKETNPKPAPKKTKAPTKTFIPINISTDEMCNGTKEVSEGMKGDIVGYIQRALNVNLGTNLSEDDHFGEETKKAVVKFQQENKKEYNLTINGKVDKATYSALMEGSPSFGCKTDVKKNTTDMNKKLNQDTKTDTQKDTPKVGPQIKRVKWIGEQVAVKQSDPKKSFLTKTLRIKDNQGLSCLDRLAKKHKLKEHPEYGNSIVELEDGRPSVVYIGINPQNKQEENFFIASDGASLTGIFQSGFEIDIECSGQTLDLGVFGNLSERQKQFVQYNVTPQSGYKVGVTPGEEEYYDKFDIVNTFKGASDYFVPNTYFVYKRKGYKVEERGDDYYNQVEALLNKVGYTYKKPDITSYAYSTRKDIRDIYPQYNEIFPNGLNIYFTGNTRSTKQQDLVRTLMTDIEKSVDSPDGKTCRNAINILYDAKLGWDKKIIYFANDGDLQVVREYVKRCQVKFEKNFFSFLGGGAKEKYEELKSKKHGPNGVMKFNLSENLNSLIKKKLLTIKEQKENNKIVKTIVESRLKMIVESIKKDKNIDRLSLSFMGELNQLNEQGLVNEDFGENLKNIFGSDLSSMPKTFFENIFDKILTNINMNDSSLKKSLVLMSEKNPLDIVKAFKDCSSMSDLISKSIVEILHDDISSEDNSTGQVLSSVKTLLGQEIKKDEFIKKVKNNIDDLVCQEFTKLKSNAENLISKIKGNSNDDLSGNL
jgi:hypothetical protein